MQQSQPLGVLMLRTRIDVAAVFNGRTPRTVRRRPMVDLRAMPEIGRSGRISTRYSRAVTMADAAMIIALGDAPRSARRCAINVNSALGMLDDTAGEAARDAADVILSRCRDCRRCG
jgi:hypothetical protein